MSRQVVVRSEDLNERTADEKACQAVRFLSKSLAGSIPALGAAAAELFDLTVSDPATKRRDRMIMALANGLRQLVDDRVVTEASLQDPAGETSALFLQAVTAAARSAGEAKFDALRNAAITGAQYAPEERYVSLIVVALLERLTEAHLAMLKVFERLDPPRRLERGVAVNIGVRPPGDIHRPQDIAINHLILADLMSLGILANEFQMPGHSIADWSTDPKKDGTSYYALTDMGWIVLTHIGPSGGSEK